MLGASVGSLNRHGPILHPMACTLYTGHATCKQALPLDAPRTSKLKCWARPLDHSTETGRAFTPQNKYMEALPMLHSIHFSCCAARIHNWLHLLELELCCNSLLRNALAFSIYYLLAPVAKRLGQREQAPPISRSEVL